MRLRWAFAAAVLAALWLCTPPDLPLCGFRWLTGRECPLCGMTHAFFALAKGQVIEALHWNPLSPLAAGMIVGTLWDSRRMSRAWMPCLVVFAIYGVFRAI